MLHFVTNDFCNKIVLVAYLINIQNQYKELYNAIISK